MIRLTLPLPPSVNDMFLDRTNSRGRRPLSPKYRDWKMQARWRIKAAEQQPISGAVIMFAGFDRVNMRADCDNRIKPLQDAIKDAGLIKDDSRIVSPVAWWTRPNDPARPVVNVLIVPAASLTAHFSIEARGKFGAWTVDLFNAERE